MNTFVNEFTSNRSIRLAGVAVLVLLALFLLALTWDKVFGRDMNDPYNTITVEGTGSAARVPDVARITFTVTESSNDVATAQKAATDKTDAALKAVEEEGVEERDVKTLSYNINPRYEYKQSCFNGMCPPAGSPTISGYDVSQTIEVKVRETDKAGAVLARLGSVGVQNVSGPEFVVDDESEVSAEARAQAIEEARAKAKDLAKELGVRLGDVVSFSENNYGYPKYESYYGRGGVAMDAVAQAAPTLPTGENETEVTVMITYEIH